MDREQVCLAKVTSKNTSFNLLFCTKKGFHFVIGGRSKIILFFWFSMHKHWKIRPLAFSIYQTIQFIIFATSTKQYAYYC